MSGATSVAHFAAAAAAATSSSTAACLLELVVDQRHLGVPPVASHHPRRVQQAVGAIHLDGHEAKGVLEVGRLVLGEEVDGGAEGESEKARPVKELQHSSAQGDEGCSSQDIQHKNHDTPLSPLARCAPATALPPAAGGAWPLR